MTARQFTWDRLVHLFLTALGLILLAVFLTLSVFFKIINLVAPWHRQWRWIGVWNLVLMRFIMRQRNLHDLSGAPRERLSRDSVGWHPRYRYQRTADGTFNDPKHPYMGSAGTHFGRNFLPSRLSVEGDERIVEPNPREISRALLTRDRFRPAKSLNLLAAAWIQFQVHDWVNHRRHPAKSEKEREAYLPDIPLKEDDDWPEPVEKRRYPEPMRIRRTLEDPERHPKAPELPRFENTETHWWDGSQLYGSSPGRQEAVRAGRDGHLKLVNGRLPSMKELDPELHGIDLTGFNDNWWVGLSLFHTLFALEHNAICDRLRDAYPDRAWDDERLFQTARLINTALIAKIHTVEWTPAILGHPTLQIGMKANWWGLLTERVTKNLGRFKLFKDVQEQISGIPASETDHHTAPYSLTEEFVAVYRMHPLIPDEIRFYYIDTDELIEERTLMELQGNQTRPFMDKYCASRSGVLTNVLSSLGARPSNKHADRNTPSMADLFYSFGVAHPGALTLNNFPRALQTFKRIKDEGGVRGEVLDLAAVDIMRDRERGVPRYNQFRAFLLLPGVFSYRQLVGLPLIPWLSRLPKSEREERRRWARMLKDLYARRECEILRRLDLRCLDLMVGLFAEGRPRGFGFSDTAFRIFVLMASRRLKSDRFYTEDFKPEIYTELGMRWVNENGLKSVLQRHYPQLTAAMGDADNPFAPWQRVEQPPPAAKPFRPMSLHILGIGSGAFAGWVGGTIFDLLQGLLSDLQIVARPLEAPVSHHAIDGAVVGGGIGAVLVAGLYLYSDFLLRRLSDEGRLAVVYLFAVAGAVWKIVENYAERLGQQDARLYATQEAAIGAAIGLAAGLTVLGLGALWRGLGPRHVMRRLFRLVAGGVVGALFGWIGGAIVQFATMLDDFGLTWGVVWGALWTPDNLWWVLAGALVGGANRGFVGIFRGAFWGWVVGWLFHVATVLAGKGLTLSVLFQSFVSGRAILLATIAAAVGGLLALVFEQVRWQIRKYVWDLVTFGKFVLSRPIKIKTPRKKSQKIDIDDDLRLSGVVLEGIKVARNIPRDEKSWSKTGYPLKALTFPLQKWAYSAFGGFFSPMQENLPSIDSDPEAALERAYSGARRRSYDPPELPAALEGSPDLGRLAVRGPYACYTRRIEQGPFSGGFEWNLRELDDYKCHPGLCGLGVRCLFRVVQASGSSRRDEPTRKLQACRIETREWTSEPGAPNWPFAKKLMLCALSNHISLVRHWNWIHLTPAAHLAIATRNTLPHGHPVYLLLWPHFYGLQQSNYFGTVAQMEKGGDFETIFSFRHKSLERLFVNTHRAYDFSITDPKEDARKRGILDAPLALPTQHNLESLFDVMLAHTERVVSTFYPDVSALQGDPVREWLGELNRLIPNGTGYRPEPLSPRDLARLLARFIYCVTALHEMVGSFLWNYQLWTHRQPVRLYEDGSREPLDVYQRLVNYNYLLNVNRTPLVADYSYLADGLSPQYNAQRSAFRRHFVTFKEDLEALDEKMREEGPWAVWKIYPLDLEAHINA